MTTVYLICSIGCGVCSFMHLCILGVWVFRLIADGDLNAVVFIGLQLALAGATAALSWTIWNEFLSEKEYDATEMVSLRRRMRELKKLEKEIRHDH